MRLKRNGLRLIIFLLAITVITSFLVYHHQQAVYTASLATRPFNMGLIGKVSALEPGIAEQHSEKLLASAIYEGLVRYDEESGEIKPLLARKWKYSADKKTLTLTLDTDIKFSSGKKLTASDVKASWEANFGKGQDWSNLANLFLPVSGGFDRIEGKSQEISGVKVVDNHTIRIKLEQPNAIFIYMLTNPLFWVYDTTAVKDPDTQPPPGTGPFILKEHKDNSHFLLVRNEKYHGDKPHLVALDVKVYEDANQAMSDYKAGKLDYLDQVPLDQIKAIRKDPVLKKRFIYRPLLYTYSLGFNISQPPYDNNYSLRRALNYAIDRKSIANNLLGGAYQPLRGVLPEGVPGYDADRRGYGFDQEKARQLLEEAGYPGGQGLEPLVISYDNSPGNQEVMQTVAEQLGKIGVRAQLQPLEWDYYRKQVGRIEMSCFRLGWQADYPDADSFMYNLFHSKRIGISNYYSYNNPQLDRVLDASRQQASDSDKRLKLINQAENIVVDDAPSLFLFQKMSAKLTGEGVDNLKVDSMEMIDWTQIELFKTPAKTAHKLPAER